MNKNIKVIYVLSSSRIYGGATKSFMSMLIGLKSKGVEPLVILPDKRGLYAILQNYGIFAKSMTYRTWGYPPFDNLNNRLLFPVRLIARLTVNFFAVLRLSVIAKRFSAEIVHTNVSTIDIGFRTSRILGVPHVWHIREYGDRDFGFRYFPSKRIFVNRLRMKGSYPICITKDIAAYNMVDPSYVVYNGIASIAGCCYTGRKQKFFLYAGRLEKNKGIESLIKAYSEFIASGVDCDVRLKIAGDTDNTVYKEYIYNLVDMLGIKQKVDILGMTENVYEIMSLALATVVPSYSEGFGRVVAEAMFNGCLVVGRNTAGIKEQFDNGLKLAGQEIGLRYEKDEELADVLSLVCRNGIHYYQDMIYRAQHVVTSLYSTEASVRSIYGLYCKIVSE